MNFHLQKVINLKMFINNSVLGAVEKSVFEEVEVEGFSVSTTVTVTNTTGKNVY